MTNDELKKKILSIVRGAILEADELPFIETTNNIADALIAAGIGDVKETEHRAEVAELALLNLFLEGTTCCDLKIAKINRNVQLDRAEKELEGRGKER